MEVVLPRSPWDKKVAFTQMGASAKPNPWKGCWRVAPSSITLRSGYDLESDDSKSSNILGKAEGVLKIGIGSKSGGGFSL